MPRVKRTCRVCGKTYEACATLYKGTVFRWQDVACCPEHGAEYLKAIQESGASSEAIALHLFVRCSHFCLGQQCPLQMEMVSIKNKKNVIRLVIDNDVLARYENHYFSIHTRATKKPIAHPYHESINTWMIMRRAMMNALKQRWKDFIRWFVAEQGYANLRIDRCEVLPDKQTT